MYHHVDRAVKAFLEQIFCVVGANSPYKTNDFVHVLLDAIEHTDFTNNTCVRVGGPTGETVFARLHDVDFDGIKNAFYRVLDRVYTAISRPLRNRRVALAFDTTDEPYFGKVQGFYIHPYRPVRGSTGCFKYITVSIVDRDNKLILGSLPVRIGADIVKLVMQLLEHARRYVYIDVALFDRGFDDYRLVEALQNAGVRYELLWRKSKWTKAVLKSLKRGEVREVCRQGTYSRDKTTHRVRLRFVLIKKYRRYNKGKAYDWVFATNTRQKWQHHYVDKYRKRWGIETAFRVLDNIQIKTTTKNEVIRYFINMFCCLVYNLWKTTTIFERAVTLKNFVAEVVEQIRNLLRAIPSPHPG